ncbi:MAG: DUF5675 family protein [Geminicoccaceae bacterium]
MKLTLNRFALGDDATVGTLAIDDEFQCFTLEDRVRAVKVVDVTAIPYGSYRIKPRRFGRIYDAHVRRWAHRFVMELCEVPNFTHILIHCGNTHEDTAGCILVGSSANMPGTDDYSIGQSRRAYQALYGFASDACRADELWIDIVGDV